MASSTKPAVSVIAEPELTCFQSVLRNRCIYTANWGCQLMGTVTSLTAAVAGYYFGTVTPEYQILGYSLGALGTFFSFYNCCALSYTVDYKSVLDESRKVAGLQKAKAELERQVTALDAMERGMTKEGDELEANVVVLRGQVDKFTAQILELEAQIRRTVESESDLREVRSELRDQERSIASGISKLSAAVAQANSHIEGSHAVVLEVAGAAEALERRLSLRERAFLDSVGAVEEASRARVVKLAMETFKRENLHEYEALIARFPDLRV